jgi:hypothetical protein
MADVVPLLHPTQDNLKSSIRSLPLHFIQGILVHIQSISTVPQNLSHEWFVERLLHEVEDIGMELFVQKLDPETVQESCSLLNLGANEEEVCIYAHPTTSNTSHIAHRTSHITHHTYTYTHTLIHTSHITPHTHHTNAHHTPHHTSHITHHASPITHHPSRITHHASRITHHASRITHHITHSIHLSQSHHIIDCSTSSIT